MIPVITKSMLHLENRFQDHLHRWNSHPAGGQVQWIGLRAHSEVTQNRVVRNDRPEKNLVFEDYGVMLEVMVDGHLGYFGTSDLSSDGLDRAFERALEATQASSHAKAFSFLPHQSRPAIRGQYQSAFERPLSSVSPKAINEFLIEATQSLKTSDKIIDRAAGIFLIETDILLLSTSGTRTHQNFQKVAVDLSACAAEGTQSQTRSWNGGYARCYQIGAEFFNLKELQEAGRKIGEEATALLKAENCPTGIKDLILMPDQMTLQIHESIGHPLELDRILGDERNYAGSSFVKLSDFGNLKYGSQLMNATFDPHVSNEFAGYAFDEVGNPATKEYLIKDGLLVAALGSLESQARAKVKGVANSRSAAWNRAPIDRMANLNLEGGTSHLEDLIGMVDDGVLMHSNKSWSIDDYRRKFQFGCEFGERIKGGKIVGIVRNPNYRGTTVPFWNSLAGLCSKTENFGSPYCGKGEPSQVIRVGHRSPASLFKNIEVFGGSQ